jgi:hypothetical protein
MKTMWKDVQMEGWEKNSHKLSCNVVASTTKCQK